MPKRATILSTAFLLAISALTCAQPATQPAIRPFTISKATTIVDGPLNKDGTINYVQVINDRLGKGITRENNAAIQILQATTTPPIFTFNDRFLEELHVPLLEDDKIPIQILDVFAAARLGHAATPEVDASLTKARDLTRTVPWKAADAPLVAEWLAHSEKGLKIVESACEKPRCYIPWVGKTTPPTWLDSMPPLDVFRVAAEPLVARAMLRAGEGDQTAALADLQRVQILAQFAASGGLEIDCLVAVSIDALALHAYEGLAISGRLTAPQLAVVRKQIDAAPMLPLLTDAASLEDLLTLDDAMMFARGDVEHLIRIHAGAFEPDGKVNLGDLSSIDLDAMMIAMNKEQEKSHKIDALPFDQRLKGYDDRTKAAIAETMPATNIFLTTQKTGIPAVEEFLKLRHAESRADYSARIGRWLAAGSPEAEKRVQMVQERGLLERSLSLLSISLAEYHLAHNAYPDSLSALGQPVLQDPFSGKDIIYRRQDKGYILYSVGLNQKDDNGLDDDHPVKAEK